LRPGLPPGSGHGQPPDGQPFRPPLQLPGQRGAAQQLGEPAGNRGSALVEAGHPQQAAGDEPGGGRHAVGQAL